MNRALDELCRSCDGIVSRRHYPELARLCDSALRSGELVRAFHGIYVHADLTRDWRTIARAAGFVGDGATVVGEAAAGLSFWPELTPRFVEIAGTRSRCFLPGVRMTRRVVPAATRTYIARIPMTTPAMTALDLIDRHGGEAIDEALRSRMATIAGLRAALDATPGRDGNRLRRQLVLDSRAEPWSEAERLAHRTFRAAGITRWHANVRIVLDGKTYFQDIAMDDCPVVVEVDGKIHLRSDIFERDRVRGNAFLLAGKSVLHFTWLMLSSDAAGCVAVTRRAIDRFS